MSPSNEYSGLMSFRINLFDLTVQGALKSLLQHHNSKASIFQHSAFFMSQLLHPYITTGKTIALTIENSYIRAYFMGRKLFVIVFLIRLQVANSLETRIELIPLSIWRRQWQPTPVFLPGESQGWRSLVGCSPWGREELDILSDFTFTFMHWRRKWQPTPVFLPGESQGQRSLLGCRLWGCTESDTTEAT